jgi:hypothetical protein
LSAKARKKQHFFVLRSEQKKIKAQKSKRKMTNKKSKSNLHQQHFGYFRSS